MSRLAVLSWPVNIARATTRPPQRRIDVSSGEMTFMAIVVGPHAHLPPPDSDRARH